MKNFALICILLISFFGCYEDSKQNDIENFIPAKSELTFKIYEHNAFYSFQDNKLVKTLNPNFYLDSVVSLIAPLKTLTPYSEAIIALDSNKVFTYATRYDSNLFSKDSLVLSKVDSIANIPSEIHSVIWNEKELHYKIQNGIITISNSHDPLNGLPNRSKNTSFNVSDSSATFSLFHDKPLQVNLGSDSTQIIGTSTLLNFDSTSNTINANGIVETDSSKTILNSFSGLIPQENTISKICPKDSDGFMSITYNDYIRFKSNLSIKYNQITKDSISSYFDNTIEIGHITKGTNKAIVLKSIDAELTEEAFENSTLIDGHKDVKLFKVNFNLSFSDWFYPIITEDSIPYYFRLSDFFVFSNDTDYLKTIITGALNENTLDKSDQFRSMTSKLNDESTLFFYGNSKSLQRTLNNLIDIGNTSDLPNDLKYGLQFINDDSFAHMNLIIDNKKPKNRPGNINEQHTIKLDTDAISAPQLVTNHRTKEKELIVQDINNTLYLISNSGTILWKKKVDSPILGEIQQLDTYKNGRLQLIFNTKSKLYVLDRNGNDVNKFPLSFVKKITQPVSVFDYDKKKEYRLLLTQGSQLTMLDKHGNKVSGFNYNSSSTKIHSQPKHFRVGSKDFIVFAKGNSLEILNRQGKTRIPISDKIDFSTNAIYWHKSKFTTTTKNGNLFQADLKGRTSRRNLNLSESHSMTASSKTMVTLDDNILKIKSHSAELPYGDHTDPKIFYLNDKIYVSVTDKQTNKVYLYDSMAKSIANFPVYGSSEIILDNIDSDSNLEFIVKGDSNSLLIYEID